MVKEPLLDPVLLLVSGRRYQREIFYAGLCSAGILGVVLSPTFQPAFSILLATVTPVPILLHGRFPRIALAASLSGLVVLSFMGRDTGLAVTTLAVVLTTYVASQPRSRPLMLFALAGTAVAVSAYYEAVAAGERVAPGTFVFGLFGTALAIGLGVSLRLHRDALAELSVRNRELEVLRVVEARQAVAEERTRIAGELHDVVAHHVSAILVRAQAAEHVRARRPEESEAALRYVITSAAETLTALRGMVGLLRASTPASLAPQPCLDDVPDLVSTASAAGSPVELIETGQREPLPADIQLTAYRMLQESVTNSLRYAPGAPITINLRWQHSGLDLTVINTAPAARHAGIAATIGGGHGLQVMHERLALHQGTVTAGPTPVGGWKVTAHLPRPGHAASGPAPDARPHVTAPASHLHAR